MATSPPDTWLESGSLTERLRDIRRAFREFLTVPTIVIAGFLLLAGLTYGLDQGQVDWLEPMRSFMQGHVFADANATGELLGTIAGGLITVTSITFSLLLLAVQQAGSSLTSQVYDQFLRRRVNQVYFGAFVGLALYSLAVLATVDAPFNPVIGASVALLLTMAGLLLLIVLLYTTINQMRPVQIIEAIHDHTLHARERQRDRLRRTRRAARFEGVVRVPIHARQHGYIVAVDIGRIDAAARAAQGPVEVLLERSIGGFISFQDTLAVAVASNDADAERMVEATHAAIRLERSRDLQSDPAYGIEQLVTIAWTCVSTSKQNPAPGLAVTRGLRDLLARWSVAEAAEEDEAGADIPLVYPDDVPRTLLDAFASLAVVASESLQHQVLAEVYEALAVLYGRLPPEQQVGVEDLVLRSLATLGEHVPTRQLDAALTSLRESLLAWGRRDTAAAVREAQRALDASIGHLNSRGTRVPQA